MTCSVYVFGNLTDGYTQYPDDYAIGILQQFHSLSSSPSQVIIHRENSLMYYGYIRGLDNSMGYIGFCVLINGMMLTNISQLFNIFEDVVTEMAAKGEIISLSENGGVVPVVSSLSAKQNEIESIANNIQSSVIRMLEDAVKLPPVSYDVSSNDKKYFSILDDNNEIVEAAGKYGYTYISKDENPDTPQLMGYRSVVKKLHEEKVSLSKDYDDLKSKYNRLNEQKKQYTKVAILAVVVVFAIIGLLRLKTSLDSTQGDLAMAHSEIAQKETNLETLNNKLNAVRRKLASEEKKREHAEEELSELKGLFNEYMPIIITKVEVANVYSNGEVETDFGESIRSDYTMYLKPRITYLGLKLKTDEEENEDGEEKEMTLRVKLYSTDRLCQNSYSPSDCSWTEDISINEGENVYVGRPFGSREFGTWDSGTYRYEFWYNSICLKSYSFTIY